MKLVEGALHVVHPPAGRRQLDVGISVRLRVAMPAALRVACQIDPAPPPCAARLHLQPSGDERLPGVQLVLEPVRDGLDADLHPARRESVGGQVHLRQLRPPGVEAPPDEHPRCHDYRA
jgi:hypothetical protein